MTPKISINLWKSMPLAKKAIQALSWYHTSPALSASHLRRVQLSFRLQVSTQCPYVQTRDYTQRTRKVQNAGVRNVRSMHQKPDLESRYFDDIAYIRDLDTYGTYQRLRQLAVAGDYPGTSKFVHYLVKHRGEKPNVRIYDALLLSNTDHENGSASEAANLLGEMENEGITPDATTIHAALRVLAVHPDYLLRHHLLEELRQRWLSLTKDGWHSMITGLLKERQIEVALDALEHMQREGIKIESWLYDMMIYTLCSAEEFDMAVSMIERRVNAGDISISALTWYHLLDTASRAFHHSATLFAYRARVETFYLNPPAGMCINILDTAARHADTYLATSVLRILGHRSGNPIQLHHYEALIETYAAAHDLQTALTLLTIMAAAGYAPTEASTRSIYTHLCQSTTLPKKASLILKDLYEQDRQVPIQAVNVVMQASIFHRDLEFAMSLYKSFHTFGSDLSPNTASFNILFRGCAQAEQKDIAMFLASEMIALKIPPDALTYDRLILVCLNCEAGVGDAWRYFEEASNAGWWPRDGTIVALARRICELGDNRIWRLERNSDGKGISTLRLQMLIRDYWKGGEEEARKELNRER